MRLKKNVCALMGWIVAIQCFCFPALVRADGYAGEYLVTQRWRELNSSYSPLSNAAFLTEENYLTGRLAATPLLQGYFQLFEIGGTLPIGLYQSAGLSWIGQASGKYHRWTGGVEDTNSIISTQENQFCATYAVNPWRGLSVGLNANVMHRLAFDTSRVGFGADLGVSYRILKNPMLGSHLLGINAQNILAPKLEADIYTRNLRLTWYATYHEKLVESNLDFCLKDFLARASDFMDSTGALSAKVGEWELSGRVGFSILQMFRLYALFGTASTGMNRWGAALSINMPAVNRGRDLGGAYQFGQISKENVMSNTFYLRGEFGVHREEAFAKRMARKLDMAPNAIYLRAMTLYNEGKYWEALFLFYQILNDYPDFFNNDQVAFYIGACQEKMDMREIGLLSFQALEVEYPWSNAVIPGRLASMRIHYRNGDFFNVEKIYKQLMDPTVSDTIKNSADYIMAEALIERKDYARAIELLNRIPPDRPEYVFAQHSAAVVLLSQDRPADAVTALQNCVMEEQKGDPARKEIVNRSYLLLGYVLYENLLNEDKPLAKAVGMLRQIDAKSIYFDEAQLALGWCAIKGQNFSDCIASGVALLGSKNALLHFEGSLIAAYGYMSQQKYNEAKDILAAAAQKIETLRAVSEDSVALEKQRYLDTRASYDFLAKKVAECAQKQQTGVALQENASLHTEQRDAKKKIDASLDYFDAYKKNLFLTRNYEAIKQDITYMLAVVSKRTAVNPSFQKATKAIEKEKNIDKEIEKLKNEMEKIEDKTK